MASTLVQLREERNAKAKSLHDIFTEAGPEMDMSKVTLIDGDSATKAAEIRRLNDELSDVGKQVDEAAALEDIRDSLPTEAERRSAGKSVGLTIAEQGDEDRSANPRALKAMIEADEKVADMRAHGRKFSELANYQHEIGEVSLGDLEAMKTTITLATGGGPVEDRRPVPVLSAQNRFTVSDLMSAGTITGNTFTYMEETTFTNAAAETAEGTAKPEGALALTKRTETLAKIAEWIPATDEVLEDNEGFESYVRARLIFGVEKRREQQLLTGTGVAPNLLGITNRSGIQTQAKGTDPTPDAFYKAMVKVMTTGDADPDAHVINPLDWQDIRLLRTADGIYIWGSPSESGPERLWGLPVRVTSAMTENTGLTGAFRPFAQVFRKAGAGVRVLVSTEHASFFTENKVAILAEERLLLAVYRVTAFCTVTGI